MCRRRSLVDRKIPMRRHCSPVDRKNDPRCMLMIPMPRRCSPVDSERCLIIIGTHLVPNSRQFDATTTKDTIIPILQPLVAKGSLFTAANKIIHTAILKKRVGEISRQSYKKEELGKKIIEFILEHRMSTYSKRLDNDEVDDPWVEFPFFSVFLVLCSRVVIRERARHTSIPKRTGMTTDHIIDTCKDSKGRGKISDSKPRWQDMIRTYGVIDSTVKHRYGIGTSQRLIKLKSGEKRKSR
ncbi:hypothetical protein BDR04DRAFT_1202443 [Suillus decipiens]|nr:hypothetical protein BDR04DRAFT_1202443 [Suillus decipiens]